MNDKNDAGPLDDLIENLTGQAAGDWSDRPFGLRTGEPHDPEEGTARTPRPRPGGEPTERADAPDA